MQFDKTGVAKNGRPCRLMTSQSHDTTVDLANPNIVASDGFHMTDGATPLTRRFAIITEHR
jgi:hypothetical protein